MDLGAIGASFQDRVNCHVQHSQADVIYPPPGLYFKMPQVWALLATRPSVAIIQAMPTPIQVKPKPWVCQRNLEPSPANNLGSLSSSEVPSGYTSAGPGEEALEDEREDNTLTIK